MKLICSNEKNYYESKKIQYGNYYTIQVVVNGCFGVEAIYEISIEEDGNASIFEFTAFELRYCDIARAEKELAQVLKTYYNADLEGIRVKGKR